MSQRIPASFKMPTHLTCNLCLQSLPLGQFRRNANRYVWSGRGAWSGLCLSCSKIYRQTWFLQNRDAYNARRRAKYAENKAREKSMAGWSPEWRTAVEAAEAKRKQAAKERAERTALYQWIHVHSPTYKPPKLLYGRWKGMTMAQVWKIKKAERGDAPLSYCTETLQAPGGLPESRMTSAQAPANLEALRALHEAQRNRDDE